MWFPIGDTRLAWLWLPLRIFLGWEWLDAGLHKFSDPSWINGGAALMKYWERGLQMKPKPVIAVDWYRAFIQYLLDSGAYRLIVEACQHLTYLSIQRQMRVGNLRDVRR